MDVIVKKPYQLTHDWAQKVIAARSPELVDEIFIDKVSVTDIDIGTTTRVRLSLDHNDADNLPKRWFVKMPSLSWQAKLITALPRLLPTEVRFYNELADIVPLKKPKVLVAQNRFGLGSTLVMADVTELGAIPGQSGEALSAGQARAVVEQLALFHAACMGKAHDPRLCWLAGPVRRLEDALGTALAVPLMRRGLRLAEAAVPQELHAHAINYARNRKQVMRFLSTTNPTLVHHDCHPGNLFWQDGQPGFLDWQMVRIGEGVSDVSYFLATALEPEVRRACELELLAVYRQLICDHCTFKPSFDELLLRYRVHLAYPFEAMVVTLAVGGLMQLASNLTMIQRSAQAVADHNSLRLVLAG